MPATYNIEVQYSNDDNQASLLLFVCTWVRFQIHILSSSTHIIL